MADRPQYLPNDISYELRVVLDRHDGAIQALGSGEGVWQLERLLERAFATGYADGHHRGYISGWQHGREDGHEHAAPDVEHALAVEEAAVALLVLLDGSDPVVTDREIVEARAALAALVRPDGADHG